MRAGKLEGGRAAMGRGVEDERRDEMEKRGIGSIFRLSLAHDSKCIMFIYTETNGC